LNDRRTTQQLLTTQLLIEAYSNGYFPMADSRSGPLWWYSPDPRAVIPLEDFKISRSLRQRVRKGTFEIRIDTSFEAVIRACAEREETWISDEIIRAYVQLHRDGYAHSVESWRSGGLAGGLYGVSIHGAFFGESMFARESDASKVALVALVEHLKKRNFGLLDSQFINDHMRQFGTREIPRTEYLRRLRHALKAETNFTAKVLDLKDIVTPETPRKTLL
jgi:leucyl/phenylalanyl-tRNA--protein transferase